MKTFFFLGLFAGLAAGALPDTVILDALRILAASPSAKHAAIAIFAVSATWALYTKFLRPRVLGDHDPDRHP